MSLGVAIVFMDVLPTNPIYVRSFHMNVFNFIFKPYVCIAAGETSILAYLHPSTQPRYKVNWRGPVNVR
jgi:hypothetical protein